MDQASVGQCQFLVGVAHLTTYEIFKRLGLNVLARTDISEKGSGGQPRDFCIWLSVDWGTTSEDIVCTCLYVNSPIKQVIDLALDQSLYKKPSISQQQQQQQQSSKFIMLYLYVEREREERERKLYKWYIIPLVRSMSKTMMPGKLSKSSLAACLHSRCPYLTVLSRYSKIDWADWSIFSRVSGNAVLATACCHYIGFSCSVDGNSLILSARL